MRLFKFRRDPTDPVDRVERYWHGRRLRLVIGIHVAEDFSSIQGVVARAQGEGKYLRLQQLSAAQTTIRRELAQACRRLCQSGGGATAEFIALTNDLAMAQAELISRLRGACESAAESLLAVCVSDPGLWTVDFDGRQLYSSFCNPDLLSMLSGVSVIDALPAKDLAAGGHGWPLTPLAGWLLWADRTSPIATYSRLLVLVERGVEFMFLPVSDGLDDEYPDIRHERFVGSAWLGSLEDSKPIASDRRAEVTSANGGFVEALQAEWSKVLERVGRNASWWTLEKELADRTHSFATSQGIAINDLLVSARSWSREQLKSAIDLAVGDYDGPLQIYWAGRQPLDDELSSALRKRFPSSSLESIAALGFDAQYVAPVLIAAMGTMHIDQMPSNLPWLTGVETPRILGRLTPGAPNQWRTLVREMADYHPPAMRLREAV